jgi:hypothetical protein
MLVKAFWHGQTRQAQARKPERAKNQKNQSGAGKGVTWPSAAWETSAVAAHRSRL